jgi:hypothetical protein
MTRDPKEMTKAEFLKHQADQWPKEWTEKYGWKPAKPKEDPTGEYDVGEFGRELDHYPSPEEQVNWWEPPEVRRDTIYYWEGEPWITFYWACIEIKRRLGWSIGAAQGTLRELCAKRIRSMRYEVGFINDELGFGPNIPIKDFIELIKPSEWLKAELDLDLRTYGDAEEDEPEGVEGYCVEVTHVRLSRLNS